MTKVSIIMPIYNGAEFIEKSIESVSKQTLKDIELICVDDGSEDNTLEVLKELKEKYPFIRILTQENQGSGKARNYGIDESEGEYIAFLDADDIFVDEMALEKMFDLGHGQSMPMVCANLKKLSPSGKPIYNPNYRDNNYYEFTDYECIKPEEYGVPWAFYKNIYRKSFLDEYDIRFRDLIRGQDPVFLAEVLAHVDEIYGIPLSLYAYLFPVSGKPYIKVNSHKKKLHYITHYKMTFDIFDENGLSALSEKYKPKFLNYLRYSVRAKDFEIYDIIIDLFGKKNHYFDNFANEFMHFKISHLLNRIYLENNEEFFQEAKKELSTYEVWNNPLITSDNFRLMSLVNACETFEDFQKQYPSVYVLSLKDENKELRKKKRGLEEKRDRLKKNLEKRKRDYNSIVNSSSMKVAAPFKKYMRR